MLAQASLPQTQHIQLSHGCGPLTPTWLIADTAGHSHHPTSTDGPVGAHRRHDPSPDLGSLVLLLNIPNSAD